MYFPKENYSHFKQEKINFGSNCESKPKILLEKRKVIFFTPYQLKELEQIFDKNKNKVPSIYIRKELAKKMGVSESKISSWLRYRVQMWKCNSESDCKSESKSEKKFRRLKSHELIELERVFEKNHYPDKNIINDLAQRTGISELKISNWFKNKRIKLKKHVSLLTCTESGCDNFITSSTENVNYPSFYSRAETMPPDYPYRHTQLQSRPDFSTAFFDEQYSSHHVPLTDQQTDFNTQSFSTVGPPTYSFPATVTYPESVLTHL